MSSLPRERRDDPRRGRRQAKTAREVRGLKIREDGNSVEIEPAGKLLRFRKAVGASAPRGLLRFGSLQSRGLGLLCLRSLALAPPVGRSLVSNQDFRPDVEKARAGSVLPFLIKPRAGDAMHRAELGDGENWLFHWDGSVFVGTRADE